MVKFIKELNIIEKIVLLLLLLCSFVNVVILIDYVCHPSEVPSFFGWQSYVVMSDAMEPAVKEKNFVVVKEMKPKKLHDQDIISVKYEDCIMMSRLDGFDNNDALISLDNGELKEKISSSNIIGKYIISIPYLGQIILFIQNPLNFTIILVILAVIYSIICLIQDKRDKAINGKMNLYKKGG